MKNKILITFLAILGLFIINIFSINSFYNNFEGKKLYENKDFSGSLNYFKKNKDYIGLYNLGNIYYKLGEESLPLEGGALEGVINNWKKSLEFYKNSMKINYTKQSEENYNFVKKKLDELVKKQKPHPASPKGEEQKNKKEKKGNQQGSLAPGKKEQNSGSSTKNEKGESKPQLSSQAKQQLKAYEEQLKKQQKANAKNFGKVYKEQNKNDILDNFNDFFEDDPFFNNSLLNDKNEKKDW